MAIQHNKQFKTQKIFLTEEDAVFTEIADIIEAADKMAGNFRTSHKHTPIQQRILDEIENAEIPEEEVLHVLLYGSMGSGKSTLARVIVVSTLLDHPGAIGFGARRTYSEIESTIYPDMCNFLDRYGIPYTANQKFTTLRLKNSSVFRMRSAEKTAKGSDDKAHELGSTEFSVAYMEEADELPEEFVKTLPGRMRQNIGVRRKIIVYVCNPPDKNHWLYEWFFVKNDPSDPKSRYRAFFMPVEENVMHVGEAYIRNIHEDYADNPQLYRRQVLGLFGPRVKGIPIFHQSFSRQLHVSTNTIRENWNRDAPLLRCWDFGFHRPACVVLQDDEVIGQLRIYWVKMGHRQLLDHFADDVIRETRRLFPNAQWRDYCDPSGEARSDRSELTSCDILRGKKIYPRSSKSSIDYGLSLIDQELKRLVPSKQGPVPGIIIDPSCEVIIEGFEFGYCQEKLEQVPTGETRPVKDGYYEHPMDALRYGIIHIRQPNESNKYRSNRREWKSASTEYPMNNSRYFDEKKKNTRDVDILGPQYGFNRRR